MIAFAEDKMIPRLKALWKECFGDGDDYINFYYENRFRAEDTLVWLEGTEPAAMLTMLPAQIWQSGQLLPVYYLYAVATGTAFRGRGLSTKLLDCANDETARRGGEMTVLVPASEELFAFYRKRGYFDTYRIKAANFAAKNLSNLDTNSIKIDKISELEYKRLRDVRFQAEGDICWGGEAIAYAVAENRFGGGFCCKILSRYGQSTALCYKIEDKLIVRETTLADEALPASCAALLRYSGCASAQVRLAARSAVPGAITAFGMTSKPLPAQAKDAYFNLVLD